jgi:sirohydrochlorin ferrochelatase
VTPQQAVEKMIAHWRSQVQQVLPEKPDIIVLPEACDRPSGAWREKQKLREFYECRGDLVRNMLAELTVEHGFRIVYAAHIQEADGTWRNAAQIIGRDGGTQTIILQGRSPFGAKRLSSKASDVVSLLLVYQAEYAAFPLVVHPPASYNRCSTK